MGLRLWPIQGLELKLELGLRLRLGRCRTPQAKRFGLSTSTETAETALPDGRPRLKGCDHQGNEKGQPPLSS